MIVSVRRIRVAAAVVIVYENTLKTRDTFASHVV